MEFAARVDEGRQLLPMAIDHTPLTRFKLRLELTNRATEKDIAAGPFEHSSRHGRPEQHPRSGHALVPDDNEIGINGLGRFEDSFHRASLEGPCLGANPGAENSDRVLNDELTGSRVADKDKIHRCSEGTGEGVSTLRGPIGRCRAVGSDQDPAV
jgi:hypothetical protein